MPSGYFRAGGDRSIRNSIAQRSSSCSGTCARRYARRSSCLRLPEHHSVDRQGTKQVADPGVLAAQGHRRDVPLDLRATLDRVHPVGNEVAHPDSPLDFRLIEHTLPDIAARCAGERAGVAQRDVPANSVALVAMNASFALFEIYRVRGQVPVHYRVAVLVEVQTLLAD